jgi:DNA polymerase I-like protein with 3'-5' exonuclease and polymerase domains
MSSEWCPLNELPDLRRVGEIALDTETRDNGIQAKRGPSWPWGDGYVCGLSLAWRENGTIRAHYFPLRHPDSQNFDREQVIRWLRDLIASDVKTITKNGLYDWGWLWADLGIEMPPAERLEEIDALATMVDENRYQYNLNALCAWRGFPGKDETLLLEGCAALGLIPARKRKGFKPQSVLWQLPAHLVGPYAEVDAIRTLELFESLNPVLDREGTRDAYRLEIDLLPMVHRMRRRGIRIDITAAEQARDLLLRRRDDVLAQISEKLESSVGMDEINGRKWLISTFDRLNIKYPLTDKGNPSFKRGKRGWMQHSEHWLPPLIAAADQLDQYGDNFLQQQILGHVENGRVYGEVHPHRSDFGGTRSLRFSYSHPPIQQMPKHDEELAPLIRGVFLPEEGEAWASCDFSQQEFRIVVHYAIRHKLMGAAAARDRYISNPDTDFHAYASELTGGTLSRQDGKTFNFMTIYGAGPETIALQIGKSLNETKTLLALYNKKMPFISRLSTKCREAAQRDGFFTLLNSARRHFNLWAPGGKLQEGAGPCARTEAERRMRDPGHPWYGQKLWRAETWKALNVLIQSAAATQTKEWMRACFREGVIPLLQMHDSLDLSVPSTEVPEMVAQLGVDVIKLEVPMKVDVSYGRTWGDAKHTWAELHAETSPYVELTREIPDAPERAACEGPKFVNDSDDAPNSAPAEDAALPWEETPLAAATEMLSEPPHICIHCRRDPPDGLERASAYDGAWLHLQCEEPFIHARMTEEGLTWQGASFAQTPPPPPQSEPPPASPLPSPPLPPSTPSSGNGRGNGVGFTSTIGHSGNSGARATGTTAHHSYPHSSQPKGTKVAEFIYRSLKGTPYLRVDKYVTAQGDKAFPQYRFDKGQWVKRGKNWPSIPFRLPELLAAPPGSTIDIGEGEKDALNLATLGLIATTNPGGAGKWTPELNKWFTGFARANIYEDNDVPGHKHAAAVATALCTIIPDVRVVKFRELPEKGDVSDWLKTHTLTELRARADQAPKFNALASVNAADVEIEDYDWVWPDRFALKKIGLVVGLPDEGKGLAISDIAARITRGAAWPCNEGQAPLGNVIVLSAEDDIADTIVPRLIAANADLARITILKMMRNTESERMFSLVTDLPALRQKILEIGNVAMIIIDPVTAYLGVGKVDSFRATDVRAVLSPLKELTEELRVCVLGIMHFNKKTDITNVLLRISDSLAYGAAARHVYAIVNDPDNQRRLFVRGKNNLASHSQKTLAFSIDTREVAVDKRSGNPIIRPYVVWHDEPVDITATEAMQAAAESKSPSARDNAKQFLEALLSSGPIGSTEVHTAAKENGISAGTLRRAQKELRINVKRDGPINEKGERTWQWHLPARCSCTPST